MRAATPPMTIPAIAPPERLLLEPSELEVEVDVEVEVEIVCALVLVAVWWLLVTPGMGNERSVCFRIIRIFFDALTGRGRCGLGLLRRGGGGGVSSRKCAIETVGGPIDHTRVSQYGLAIIGALGWEDLVGGA